MDSPILCIHKWIDHMKLNKEYWSSEYFIMDNGLWMENERHFKEWQSHNDVFHIHLYHSAGDIYFKLLPIGNSFNNELYDGVLTNDPSFNDWIHIYNFNNTNIYIPDI